jgi:hypothetical protein
MNATQNRTLQSFRRVRRFVDTLPKEGTPSSLATATGLLDGAITTLTRHAVMQDLAVRVGQHDTRQVAALRTELRAVHMQPIAKMARALLRDVPGLERALRLPDTHVSTELLLQAAEAMADAAAPHSATLVRHGLPATFLDEFREAIAAVRETVDSRSAQRVSRVGATVGVRQELRRGRKAVQLLDAVVGRSLAGDPSRLAEWRRAMRVGQEGVGGSAASGEPDAPAVVHIAPASAPIAQAA